jgi:hypothetical protein
MRVATSGDFSPVETIDCTSISDEDWFLPDISNPASSFQIKSGLANSGAPCLDVQGGSSTVTTKPIDIFYCTSNNPAQLFGV